MAKLHFLAGEAVTSSIELTGELLSIGRTEENDICIEDSSISKNHGCFVRDGDDYQIHDFASANGTHVNGDRILAVKLKHGDRIYIGIVETLYDNAPVQPVPTGPKIKLSLGAKQLETPQILPVTPVVAPMLSPAAPKPPGRPLGGKSFAPPAPLPESPQVEPEQPVKRGLGGKPLTPPADKTEAPKKASAPLKPKSKDERVFIRIPEKAATAPAPIEASVETPVFSAPAPKPEIPKPVVPLSVAPPPMPRPLVNLAETMEVRIHVAPQLEPVQEIPTEPYLSPIPSEMIPHGYHTPGPQEQVPVPEPPALEQIEEPPAPVEPPSEESVPAERTIKTAPAESKGEMLLRPAAPAPEAGEKKIALKPTQAPREQLRFGPKKPQS